MSRKKPNLADVASAAGSTRHQPVQQPESVPDDGKEDAPPARPPSRTGTRQIAAHFPEEVAWQLRALAVERRATVQTLMAEALNDLFQKHGKPEIAPQSRDAS